MISLYVCAGVFGLTFAIGFLVLEVVHRRVINYPAVVKARLKGMTGDTASASNASIFKNQAAMVWWTEKRWVSSRWLLRLIDQSASETSPTMLVSSCVFLALITGAVVVVFLPIWWAVAVPFAASLPILYLVRRRQARRRKMAKQLPQAFQMLSRFVRSGHTVPSAMQTVANAFPPPIADEFGRCCDEQQLGVSRESALRELAERNPIMELQMFVVALLVQGRSGGDIVAMFDNLASVVRKRQSFEGRVRALTGEGRMQAIVLVALPIIAFLGIYYLSPSYVGTLIDIG